jgi:hypothetical protein
VIPAAASAPAGRAALLSLLLLLATACQATLPAPLGRSGPSPAPAAGTPSAGSAELRAADAKLLAGDYDGAEAAYAAMAGKPDAASHYSLLLAYESRFGEAVAQAKAGVAAHRDSSSLARLTRALDWAQDLPAALSAGADAVAARPVDPLAPIFYSEALADSSRFDDAERQLRAAEKTGGQGYVAAELYRERANLARDMGDSEQELNYLELAAKEQPGFPERRLELARFDYSQQRPSDAQGVLAELRKTEARRPGVLVSGGDAAFLAGDSGQAAKMYEAAESAASGGWSGTAAALGAAEVQVAVRRDFAGAHDRLLAALRRDPASSSLYLYLRYLDLLVLKVDPDRDLKDVAPAPPDPLGAARKAALDAVNATRASVGLPALQEDGAVVQGAQAHAYFYLFNYGQPQLGGLGVHSEDPTLPGFVGKDGITRSRHFGYGGTRGAEVINHAFTPAANVGSWVDSVFHRFPLLDRDARVAGYGEAQVGAVAVSVLDVGLGDPSQGDPVAYPKAGQEEVEPAFLGNEIPDPVPEGARYPVGYPVTLQAGDGSRLDVASARLLGPDGAEVPVYSLLPGQQVSANEVSLLARSPLQAGATYTVDVSGKLDGRDFAQRWSFTVAKG